MKFIRTDELKAGMILAKPIYNKNGVLLYDRGSALSVAAIASVKNFGLLGLYTVESAEPLPPLSREDVVFEQLQTIYMFQLRDVMTNITRQKKLDKLPMLVENIIKDYGTIDHKINFSQSIRNTDDFVYKHAISCGILTAMITNKMNITGIPQRTLVTAALLFDVGYQELQNEIITKTGELNRKEKQAVLRCLEKGIDLLLKSPDDYVAFEDSLKIISAYIYSKNPDKNIKPDKELRLLVSIISCVDKFDELTAMNMNGEPISFLKAMIYFEEHGNEYPKKVIDAIAECIYITPTAMSVDLSNGHRGIILQENKKDYKLPLVLQFADNKICDLSKPEVAKEVHLLDVAHNFDRRYTIDKDTIKQFKADDRLIQMTAKVIHDLNEAKRQLTASGSNRIYA